MSGRAVSLVQFDAALAVDRVAQNSASSSTKCLWAIQHICIKIAQVPVGIDAQFVE